MPLKLPCVPVIILPLRTPPGPTFTPPSTALGPAIVPLVVIVWAVRGPEHANDLTVASDETVIVEKLGLGFNGESGGG
jgi:hypothetical protein